MRKTFKRKGPWRELKKVVLLVCEDSKSSPDYFRELKKDSRIPGVTVKPSKKSDPKGVVRYAIKLKDSKIDEIYCIIDKDEHPTYDDALLEAKKHSITVISSTPCFELWLLLHFAYTTASMNKIELNRELKKYMPSYSKKRGRDAYKETRDLIEDACKNAKELRKSKRSNPQTEVDLLVGELKSIAEKG